MAKEYKKHTTPEQSGEQNLPADFVEKNKESADDELMRTLWELYGYKYKDREPRKSAWTPEDLGHKVLDYFEFCADKNLKPTKSGLRLYIGVSRTQYYSWQTDIERYGDISNVIIDANEIMENQYINRGEKYPTFNMFMLKTKHGYEEVSKVEVTNNAVTSDEVAERIKQLGIKKDEE